MFHLTREVRFGVDSGADAQLLAPPANSFAGFPTLGGLGAHFALQVTLAGQLDPDSQYLINIKRIDSAVRQRAIGMVMAAFRAIPPRPAARLAIDLFAALREGWGNIDLQSIRLALSPYLSVAVQAPEQTMVRLSQRFEFSASHRLNNPGLSDEENRRIFGKCSNPHGHGHNYELRVTLRGEPDANGLLIEIPAFERIVATQVIDRLDHKNLNIEVPAFASLIPSVENIARIIYGMLVAHIPSPAQLHSVTVWETSKTWCEYSE
jgi:6-pyruvoyltetrahydropterin/6-carboxytetrahydropterin synthase